jgi:deoxyribonuclease-4
MEIEFVRGVKMTSMLALEVKMVADEAGVVLTAHAPYFINLNSDDEEKRKRSLERILKTARICHTAGAFSFAFHPAYYMGKSKEVVYRIVEDGMVNISRALLREGVKVDIRPELAGRTSQFGSLEEIIMLSRDIPSIKPCIDFAHLYARSIGKVNTYDEFSSVFEMIGGVLGKDALYDMHIHIAGISYGRKGERRHLNLLESDFNWRDFIKAIYDWDVKGVIISESPNLEGDALLLKNYFENLKASIRDKDFGDIMRNIF